jgi:hypothetical protein
MTEYLEEKEENEENLAVGVSVQKYRAEGLYTIVHSEPETTRHRRGNLLALPFDLEVGKSAWWCYINYQWNSDMDIGGKSCNTSHVLNIEIMTPGNPFSSFTITTENSVYEFMRER